MTGKDWELDDGQHVEELIESLESVFANEGSLKEMLRLKLNARWDTIKSGETYHDRIFNLIDSWAVAQGKVKQLILATAYWGSDNIRIQEFVEDHIENLIDLDTNSLSKYSLVELISALKQIDDFTEILNVGRSILPEKVAFDRPQAVQDLGQPKLSNWFKCFILLKLLVEDYPQFDEEHLSVFILVDHLLKKSSLDDAAKQILRAWLDQVTSSFNHQTGKPKQYSLAPSLPASGGLQAYLMIMVSPEKNKLRATASLLCIAPTGMKKEIPVHLNPESSERGVLTTQKKLPQIVAQFIQQSTSIELERSENKLGCAYYALTIELFLPIRYLCEPIDRWEIKDDFDNPVSLGSKHRLVVRSYDRVIRPGLRNAFSEAWYRTQDWLGQNSESAVLNSKIYHLAKIDCVRLGALKEELKEKIGIKITCSLPESEAEMLKFLQAMLESGVPMGTWTRRCERLASNVEEEIDQFWTYELILNPGEFLEKVRSVRASAFDDQEALDKHWGGHLTVLWDDLERMPTLEPLQKGG